MENQNSSRERESLSGSTTAAENDIPSTSADVRHTASSKTAASLQVGSTISGYPGNDELWINTAAGYSWMTQNSYDGGWMTQNSYDGDAKRSPPRDSYCDEVRIHVFLGRSADRHIIASLEKSAQLRHLAHDVAKEIGKDAKHITLYDSSGELLEFWSDSLKEAGLDDNSVVVGLLAEDYRSTSTGENEEDVQNALRAAGDRLSRWMAEHDSGAGSGTGNGRDTVNSSSEETLKIAGGQNYKAKSTQAMRGDSQTSFEEAMRITVGQRGAWSAPALRPDDEEEPRHIYCSWKTDSGFSEAPYMCPAMLTLQNDVSIPQIKIHAWSIGGHVDCFGYQKSVFLRTISLKGTAMIQELVNELASVAQELGIDGGAKDVTLSVKGFLATPQAKRLITDTQLGLSKKHSRAEVEKLFPKNLQPGAKILQSQRVHI